MRKTDANSTWGGQGKVARPHTLSLSLTYTHSLFLHTYIHVRTHIHTRSRAHTEQSHTHTKQKNHKKKEKKEPNQCLDYLPSMAPIGTMPATEDNNTFAVVT